MSITRTEYCESCWMETNHEVVIELRNDRYGLDPYRAAVCQVCGGEDAVRVASSNGENAGGVRDE